MKRSSRPRKTTNLSESVHHQLSMYALAAGAAGVGILALAQPGEAKIVYTAAHTPIRALVNLDLNHDGLPDFELCAVSNSFSCSFARGAREAGSRKHPSPFFDFLFVFPAETESKLNRIWGNSTWRGDAAAAALPAGFPIGPKRTFRPGARLMATWGSASGHQYYGGPWKNVLHHYLGLKFIIRGKVHYGWARLNVNAAHGIAATLTGYAYETIPCKSIKAGQTKEAADNPTNNDFGPGASLTSPIPDTPQPASLGMLALGAQGVLLWRRKETQEVIGQ